MTALDRYTRLEALGMWREAGGAEPREVVVSFGAATLVLTDLTERPLGHWALAGVQIVGQSDGGATLYAMTPELTTPEGDETLAIRDADMVEAIAAVSRAHLHPGSAPAPPPRRRRALGTVLGLAAFGAVAVLAPAAIRDQATGMVSSEQAEAFGARMLLDLLETHGPVCADPAGRMALARLADQAVPEAVARVWVLPLGTTGAVVLPGGSLVLDRGLVEAAADPAALAGALRLTADTDPVARMMAAAGTFAALRYTFTGRLPDAALARATRDALAPPADAPPPTVYVMLSDADWFALRGICR